MENPDQFLTGPQRQPIWLWLKKPVPKWNPGKWKYGPKPAVCPSGLILSHTHLEGPQTVGTLGWLVSENTFWVGLGFLQQAQHPSLASGASCWGGLVGFYRETSGKTTILGGAQVETCDTRSAHYILKGTSRQKMT